MTIWKHILRIADTQTVPVPTGSTILSVARQGNALCLWTLVDPAVDGTVDRIIEIVGTGNRMSDESDFIRKFIGTVVMDHCVWHIFQRI